MFDARDVRMLAGLPLEKQVIEILLEEDALMPREELRKQLVPRPTDEALVGLLSRLQKRSEISEYPSGDDKPPLIGLPGWALTKPHYKPTPVAAAPAPAPVPFHPSMENTMPKGKRLPKEQADSQVEEALQADTGQNLTSLIKASGLSRSTINSALGRLQKARRAYSTGKGRATLWLKGAKPAGNGHAEPRAAAPAPARSPQKANGSRRFGYFSDGSVTLDCTECKGTLSPEDIAELRSFAEEHVR
jgi:hypothetical protein